MAKRSKGGNTAALVTQLAQPICEQCGVQLWDVLYIKEGSDWFLRVIIDRDPAVDIDDCEKVSRALSKGLDEKDPIPDSYYLEVSSPGIERVLHREAHFAAYIGKPVRVLLIRPQDGKKELEGQLLQKEGNSISLQTEAGQVTVDLAQAVRVQAVDIEQLEMGGN